MIACARWVGAALAALLLGNAVAGVTEAEAARLKAGGDLTPVGAERAASKDGTIPAWEGGLTTSPPSYKGTGQRYTDPFPDDKPLFVVSAANLAEHRDKLSAGQVAMLTKYPQTYKMSVFATRRTAAFPNFVYEATAKNALTAELKF